MSALHGAVADRLDAAVWAEPPDPIDALEAAVATVSAVCAIPAPGDRASAVEVSPPAQRASKHGRFTPGSPRPCVERGFRLN